MPPAFAAFGPGARQARNIATSLQILAELPAPEAPRPRGRRPRTIRPVVCPLTACGARSRVRCVRTFDNITHRHRECRACGYRWITVQEPERFHRRDRQVPA